MGRLATVLMVCIGLVVGATTANTKPSVGTFKVRPSSLMATGGKVTLSAVVTRAAKCTFSVTPVVKGLPATVDCSSNKATREVALPKNSSAVAKSYAFSLKARGQAGSTTARAVLKVLAAPLVSSFTATPKTLTPAGGAVTLTASVKNATSCTFSVTPALKGLPKTDSCKSDRATTKISLPEKTAVAVKTYKFSLKVTGPGGSSRAKPAVVSVATSPAGDVHGDIYTIAGDGNPGETGDGGSAAGAELDQPSGPVVDAEGNLLIADYSGVRVVAVSPANPGYLLGGCPATCTWTRGDIYAIAGDGTEGYSGDGGPATSAELSYPSGVALDADGNVLIADTSNFRVRLVAISLSNPGYVLGGCSGTCVWAVGDIYTIAGSDSGKYRGDGDGIPATSAEVVPYTVAVDPEGNVLIADSYNERVRVVAVSASNPGYPIIRSLGCGGTCTWIVGDIFTIAGDGSVGYNGDGLFAPAAALYGPVGVAVDPEGNVLIADSFNHRVRLVAVSASNPAYLLSGCTGTCGWTIGDIYTIAGDGNPAYGGDGGPAASAEIYQPRGAAVDPAGNVLIADSNNDRVRVVALSASNPGYLLGGCSETCSWTIGDIYTIAGEGKFGYSGDGGQATSAELNGPTGMTVDSQGNVYIADSGNSVIREVVVAASAAIRSRAH